MKMQKFNQNVGARIPHICLKSDHLVEGPYIYTYMRGGKLFSWRREAHH